MFKSITARSSNVGDFILKTPTLYQLTTKPIHIGDNMWIGCRSTILKGITIGEGSVIAAGSIVTKNVPLYCLVAGNPAEIIRTNIQWNV